MIMLELNGRFPSDGVTEAAWRSGTTAFDGGHPPEPATAIATPGRHRSPGNSPRPQPSSVAQFVEQFVAQFGAQFVEQFGFHPALARRPRSVRNRLAATDAAARLRPGPPRTLRPGNTQPSAVSAVRVCEPHVGQAIGAPILINCVASGESLGDARRGRRAGTSPPRGWTWCVAPAGCKGDVACVPLVASRTCPHRHRDAPVLT